MTTGFYVNKIKAVAAIGSLVYNNNEPKIGILYDSKDATIPTLFLQSKLYNSITSIDANSTGAVLTGISITSGMSLYNNNGIKFNAYVM